jgi:hypothetical protein
MYELPVLPGSIINRLGEQERNFSQVDNFNYKRLYLPAFIKYFEIERIYN